MERRTCRNSIVVQALHNRRATILYPKLLFVFDLFRSLVRLVQTLNADPIGVCRVKAFDVERGNRVDILYVRLSFVVIEKLREALIRSRVMAHLVHYRFHLGPELFRLRKHAVMQVPVNIRDLLEFEVCAHGNLQCFRWLTVHEFRAELDGPRIIVSIDTTANAFACFENDYFQSGAAEFSCGCETGYTGSNDQCVSVVHTAEQDYSIFMLNRIRKS